jgi:hypothetical protein
MRLAQPGPLPLASTRGHAQAARNRAAGRAIRQWRQFRRGDHLLNAHPRPGQSGVAVPAQPAGLRAVGGGRAAVYPTQRPAQEPVLGRQGQHPADRIPSGLGEKRRVQHPGQLGRRVLERRCGQDRRELAPACGHQQFPRGRRTGHRVAPARSRGLGTISTAARNRVDSGWA